MNEDRKMVKVMPDIHQLKVPIPNNPLGYTNAYLLQGDGEYSLIDTGVNTEEAFNSLKQQMDEIGVNISELSQIIVTHVHGDHYGLAGRLRELSKAKISLHQLDRERIYPASTDMTELLRQTNQWLQTNGMPAHELPDPAAAPAGMRRFGPTTLPDITLHGGEIIPAGHLNLQVVWTPGHSPGHICLYEATRKILFSGDHILPVITPNVSLQAQSTLNPLADFLSSLNTLKQLEVTLVLPAHEHLFTNFQKRVEEIIQHHEHRALEILETLKTEPRTAYQIATEIIWMPELGGTRFRNLAPWDRRMAVLETLAHLEAIRIQGRVDKFSRDGVIYYRLNTQVNTLNS